MQMHNPAHPREVLKELMGDIEVTALQLAWKSIGTAMQASPPLWP